MIINGGSLVKKICDQQEKSWLIEDLISTRSCSCSGSVITDNAEDLSSNTIQFNRIHYNTLQYNSIHYNIIQYNIIQENTRSSFTISQLHAMSAWFAVDYLFQANYSDLSSDYSDLFKRLACIVSFFAWDFRPIN